jgi:hypothetical protein
MYGRVFVTLTLHAEGVTVVPVDVDSVLLRNPFSPGEELHRNPHGIAGVVDTQLPDLLNEREKLLMNGGFLYFPATTPQVAILTHEAIQEVWKQSCMTQNEQLVTTGVIRQLAKKLRSEPTLMPRVLSAAEYVNFCCLHCGTEAFPAAVSLKELQDLDRSMLGRPEYAPCSPQARKKWVFFHAACAKWPDEGKEYYARSKGLALEAVYDWVRSGN